MFSLSGGLFLFADFFITASLALPNRKCLVWIRRLIDRAIGRNNLAATAGTRSPSCSALPNVDLQQVLFCHHSPRLRRKMMKIEQKIETGGTNKTKTPILKFRMNLPLFEPVSTARHIAHCASAGALLNSRIPTASRMNASERQLRDFITAPPWGLLVRPVAIP
jgi:hypothetical protein